MSNIRVSGKIDMTDIDNQIIYCPNCGKVSHFKDWNSDNKK
jgi:hypothetical protein